MAKKPPFPPKGGKAPPFGKPAAGGKAPPFAAAPAGGKPPFFKKGGRAK